LPHAILFLTLGWSEWQFIHARASRSRETALTWNQIRHFHQQPKIITAWCQAFGPALRFLTPRRRRFGLGLAALFVAVQHPWQELTRITQQGELTFNVTVSILVVATLFGFVWLSYLAAKNFAQLPRWIRYHPQISLHAILWILLVALWAWVPRATTVRSLLAGMVIVLPFVLWRIGYMMFTAQRGKMANTRFIDHLFYCYPVWGGSDTPYGKGSDYLSANEARDDLALAKSQLAGLKLFLLAGLWAIARDLMDGVIFGQNNWCRHALGGISPAVARPADLFAQPALYSIPLSWAALYLDLIRNVLSLAVLGHIIVGWLRFFGFNVFRNTYKPLLAESVVEFWNRYYYYFKELLVNFFFYPTFTRYFKGYPRARIIAAVFAAAFVGNVYFHWLGLEDALVRGDIHMMWVALQSRLFYCFFLATGIAVSMLRQRQRLMKNKRPRGIPGRIAAIFMVWTFFSVIHIWAQDDPAPFTDRLRFFLGLIGLR